ncbi:MAG: mechanosensitive ion channel [Clostridia bacterium]|nr:mechanosensitive ion channel [Clostridia bacterium]
MLLEKILFDEAAASGTASSGLSFWETILAWLTQMGLRLLIAIVLLIVGWILIGKIAKKISKSNRLRKYDPTLAVFIQSGVNIGAKILLVVICITIVGVPGSSIAALIAALGVGIGLALQGGLSNIAGGIMLLIFRPFKIGDYIVSGGYEGVVTGINVFYTNLLTIDNRKVYLPNGSLSNAALINVTAEQTRRVDVSYTVAFDSDLEKAKKILKLIANSDQRVLKDPATAVVITGYADGAYTLTLRTWCKTEDYWDVFFGIQDKVATAFETSGIVLGHPHLNVHLDK